LVILSLTLDHKIRLLNHNSMVKDLTVAAAQFENRSGDKEYNLSIIDELSSRASLLGARVILFHEQSVTGYTFLKELDRDGLVRLAEEIPGGASLNKLMEISSRNNISIIAGILEKENGKIYKAMVCVSGNKLLSKFRKLHPFINPGISPGDEYVIFEIDDWKCSILTCYDNNVIENVRAVTLLGAQVLFAPHVTMCTPSPMPGRGFVDHDLWRNRHRDPVTLRMEFDGPKGRQWLMRWLPARAFDNGIYIVFSNAIGMDGDQLKNGIGMILDPYGETLAETRSFENEVAIARCTPEKLTLAGGYRYRNARRPELYKEILSHPNDPVVKPVWMQ
jgi:predicted amidohydrolase